MILAVCQIAGGRCADPERYLRLVVEYEQLLRGGQKLAA